MPKTYPGTPCLASRVLLPVILGLNVTLSITEIRFSFL